MYQIVQFVCLFSVLSQGWGQSISTPATQEYKSVDETVELRCDATGVPALAHMEWRKKQRDDVQEPKYKLVSNGASVQADYKETGRITVSYQGSATDRNYNLRITNIKNEDVGSYRCEVHSDGNVVAERIHTLYVFREPESVVVADSNNMTDPGGNKVFNYRYDGTNQPQNYFACQVTGGYPDPAVDVYIGGENNNRTITGLMTEVQTEYVGDILGLQTVNRVTKQYTSNLLVRPEDDGKLIQCEAKVRDSNNRVMFHPKDTALLSLSYKPTFTPVRDYTAMAQDTDVVLAVAVHAKPALIKVVWRARTSVISVDSTMQDTSAGVVSAFTLEGDHRYIATLTISEVTVDHIDNWDVTATNSLGDTTQLVKLEAGDRNDYTIGGLNDTGRPVGRGAESSLPSITLLLVPLLLALLLQLVRH